MKFRGELDPLKPYKPPRMSLEAAAEHVGPDGGANGYVKLTSNELSFGPLPEAETAMREALPRLNRYPDRHAGSLREAVAAANPGMDPENVLVGNGSSEVLLNLLQLVERPGEIVFPSPTFGLYAAISTILGLKVRKVPLTERHEAKLEALLSTISKETRAVILCNPNNPTGTYLTLDEVRFLAEALPENVLLILDEAYHEFVSDPAYGGSHTLTFERPNVVAVRTFSKAHGLAGLRVGYGLAPERIADYAERVRFPFSVNLAAQVAATASMQAHDKIRGRTEFIVRERDRLQQAFAAAGLDYIPSQGNFVMVKTGPETFEKVGILVREGEALDYPGWSRVTVGNAQENDRLLGALS
ncbi:MAG TPA: histidinol-phosphate transaminase [Rubrobacteraceae bacterium]|nr:histidinol-phosphate transaminase [Rubrobacteraceae bacterium]